MPAGVRSTTVYFLDVTHRQGELLPLSSFQSAPPPPPPPGPAGGGGGGGGALDHGRRIGRGDHNDGGGNSGAAAGKDEECEQGDGSRGSFGGGEGASTSAHLSRRHAADVVGQKQEEELEGGGASFDDISGIMTEDAAVALKATRVHTPSSSGASSSLLLCDSNSNAPPQVLECVADGALNEDIGECIDMESEWRVINRRVLPIWV